MQAFTRGWNKAKEREAARKRGNNPDVVVVQESSRVQTELAECELAPPQAMLASENAPAAPADIQLTEFELAVPRPVVGPRAGPPT